LENNCGFCPKAGWPSRKLVIVSLGFAVDPANGAPVEAVVRLTAAADLW
jgi:hypothetical protein